MTRNTIHTSLLALLLFCPLQASAGQYTAKSPEGAIYDTRTHYYDRVARKVVMRQKYSSLKGEEKKAAYQALGIQLGPQDPYKWNAVQKQRQEEKAERLVRSAQLAKVYRERQQIRAAQQAQYAYYYARYRSRNTPYRNAYVGQMTYFDYWCHYRNIWGNGHRRYYPGHTHQWPYYH
jgi:hypothetical protein